MHRNRIMLSLAAAATACGIACKSAPPAASPLHASPPAESLRRLADAERQSLAAYLDDVRGRRASSDPVREQVRALLAAFETRLDDPVFDDPATHLDCFAHPYLYGPTDRLAPPLADYEVTVDWGRMLLARAALRQGSGDLSGARADLDRLSQMARLADGAPVASIQAALTLRADLYGMASRLVEAAESEDDARATLERIAPWLESHAPPDLPGAVGADLRYLQRWAGRAGISVPTTPMLERGQWIFFLGKAEEAVLAFHHELETLAEPEKTPDESARAAYATEALRVKSRYDGLRQTRDALEHISDAQFAANDARRLSDALADLATREKMAGARLGLVALHAAIRLHAIQDGAPPATLSALPAGWLPRMPLDPFSGGEFLYDPTAGAPYSIGPDNRDDARASRYDAQTGAGDIWLGP